MNQSLSLVIGLCCYNNHEGLPAVIQNLKKIVPLFSQCTILFCYDDSTDDTYTILQSFREEHPSLTIDIFHNHHPQTILRTANIANARNSILDRIRLSYSHYDLFAMMDANEYACVGEIQLETLTDPFLPAKYNEWESVSFNRDAGYYDFWALSFPSYIYSYYHCTDAKRVGETMRSTFHSMLHSNANVYIQVYSAFNGFAIYKMSPFINCSYSSNIHMDLFPQDELVAQCTVNECLFINYLLDDCEHRKFHLESIKKNNSRIYVYNKSLFKKIDPPNPSLRGPA